MKNLYKEYQAKIDAVVEEQLQAKAVIEAAREAINKAKDRLAQAKYELRKSNEDQETLIKKRDQAITAQNRRQIKKLCTKYDLTIERETRESYYDYAAQRPVNDYTYWVDCPKWLADDPIIDGHFAYDLGDALNILEVYARHHPEHPEHDKRQHDVYMPHI